jgi:CBS domain-containing protein
MKVRDLMKQPYVVDRNMTLSEAAKIMSSKELGSVVVVSGKKINGILTERDILRNFNKKQKISKVMKKEIVTTGPEQDIDVAYNIMKKHGVKRLPVLENGKLIGMIKLVDLAGHVEDGGDFFFN